MTTIENLPDEIIMKILSFLNITDLSRFAQASKRQWNFSQDEYLQRKCVEKINLYNKRVPIDFLIKILDKGCKYLSIKNAFLEFDPWSQSGKLRTWMTQKDIQGKGLPLKYLDISCFCGHEFFLEELLKRCCHLEKFALQKSLNDEKCHQLNNDLRLGMIQRLCSRNENSLQVCTVLIFHTGYSIYIWILFRS